jgi:hypothetical protein
MPQPTSGWLRISADFTHALRSTGARRKLCMRRHDPGLARRLQRSRTMSCKHVTCPETAHLEMIAYEDTPCGVLIDACTRFAPGQVLTCSRSCAARRRAGEISDLEVGDTTRYELRLPAR